MTRTAGAGYESITLALDQGGSSSRAMLFDRRGEVVATHSIPVSERREGPDRVEQDPEELVASLKDAAATCLREVGSGSTAAVARAGLATQRSSVVCWDVESGEALTPVLSWQDRRAARRLLDLGIPPEEIRRRTGLRSSPHYGASKLAWCLEHVSAVRRARDEGRLALGPLASFLAFRLLEERPRVVDPANASRTLLWNLRARDWDPDLAEAFGVPLRLLPRCVPTRCELGTLVSGGARIPFRVLTGDQSAALFAHGLPRSDTAYVNYGTGGFVQRPVVQPPEGLPRLLASVVWSDGADVRHVVEGTINGAGSALRWLETDFGLADIEPRLDGWLRSVEEPPLFLNGVSGLAAPYWDPAFRSRFVGEGTEAEKAVAVVESIAFLTLAILEDMETELPRPIRILASGGLARLDGLCVRLASLAGIPVDRTAMPQATARGLAWLLSGSSEPWPERESSRRFEPVDDPLLDARFDRWRAETERALGT